MDSDQHSFAATMASKPASKRDLTDAQWYVALVVWYTQHIEGLDSGQFRFTIMPPNPEIQALFDARMAPAHAAITLFSPRH